MFFPLNSHIINQLKLGLPQYYLQQRILSHFGLVKNEVNKQNEWVEEYLLIDSTNAGTLLSLVSSISQLTTIALLVWLPSVILLIINDLQQ